MTDDPFQPKTFAQHVLTSRDPEVILNARDQKREPRKRPRFYGCFIVAPMPKEWRLFTKRLPVSESTADCLDRFWMKEVAPVVTKAWKRALALERDVTALEDELIGLDCGFPRGLTAAPSDGSSVCEVWFGGGLADWMKVWPRSIEAAMDPSMNWQWVIAPDLRCCPEGVKKAIQLLGLGRSWGAEEGWRTR